MSTEPTRDMYEELLTCAQRNWRRAMDVTEGTASDDRSHAMAHACSYFSTAFFLQALLKRDEDAAHEAAVELNDILSDGGAAGEYIWQLLTRAGIDPDTITA
jgi:hypothetical protein